MRLRAAGQALGRPGTTVVQVHVVLPVQAVPAEQVDGGFGHGAEGLARPQRGGVGRLRSLGAAARGLESSMPGGRGDLLEGRENVDARLRDGLEGIDRLPELLAVLGVGDGLIQAPSDAAGRLGRGSDQEVPFGPFQGCGRDLALHDQQGRGLVEGE